MKITRRVEFDAAHRLQHHDGKCRRLHGHRYVVEVTLEGPIRTDGPDRGMVRDFSAVDAALADCVVGPFDHRTLLAFNDPLHDVLTAADGDYGVVGMFVDPTAENLAAYCLTALAGLALPVVEVTVYETPRSWATATA